MITRMKVLALTGAFVASSLAATGAQAAGWIIGLVDGKSIVTIDPTSRKVTSKVDVKGAGPLVGIDVRPADGMLYGVAGDGTIVTIDAKSGQLRAAAMAHSAAVLAAGAQSLELVYDAATLAKAGVRAPFQVRELTLIDQAEQSVIELRDGGLKL